MINEIEFRPVRNNFLSKLKNDIKNINNTPEILVNADKSSNIYKLSKDDYNKYMLENITKTYKKCNKNKVDHINYQAKTIVQKLEIADRVEKMQESEAFVTIKYHKDSFPNSLSFRLINPSKSDIGKISKKILDKINQTIIKKTNVNQWKNTPEVIKWFKNIANKKKSSFINFDVENFYPSISLQLFTDAINYAKSMIDIDNQELAIIMQSRKTLLFQNGEPWVKKSNDEEFDVPQGCFDGAEVCETTGLWLLHQLSHVINKSDIGLYRDDGLGKVENMSKPQIERMKKAIVKVFKDCGLSITIECNLKTVDFLDVTFDLNNGTYKPYRKANNHPLYINKSSNHPPCILKQLPISIEKRLIETSSNENVFNEAATLYTNALKESGFNYNLKYSSPSEPNNDNQSKKSRKRKIIWFNPPFSKNVKTNIGKIFFKLLAKHFPPTNNLHKIFNRNTIKISYSCMRNIGSIISSHNRTTLHPTTTSYGCNCRVKSSCPLNGECLTPKIIYRADVENNTNNEQKYYLGLAETTFKERHRNHKKDMNHSKYENSTELAKYIWKLKRDNIDFTIKWSIVERVNGNANSKRCNLCLTEKLWIINSINDENCLNKKSEFINKCRHLNKVLLQNVKNNR